MRRLAFVVLLLAAQAQAAAPSRYTVAKRDGRWVFVAPDGEPLWLRAVYAVVPTENAPAKYGPADPGETWKLRWRDEASRRLLSWGFNAVGPYAHFAMRHGKEARSLPPYPGDNAVQPDTDGLPKPANPTAIPYIHVTKPSSYIARGGILDLGRAYAPIYGWHGVLPDVFDPRWEAYVADFLQRDQGLAWGSTGNPWMLGVMMDDSDALFGFGPGPVPKAPREHPHVADMVRANPRSHSFKALQGMGDDDFLAAFAERYFSTVAAAIRKRSPGHLVISPDLNKWGGVSRRPILAAAGRHCDVIQVGLSGPGQLAATVAAVGDKPLITWETVTANEDSPFKGAPPSVEGIGTFGQAAATQAERGKLYAEKVRWLAQQPSVAGIVWWAWSDHRGERTNFGLVNLKDEPYAPFVAAVTAANAEVARLPDRAAPPGPRPVRPRGSDVSRERRGTMERAQRTK